MAMTGSARSVRATAPVRICDLGGWTDTWFAGHGRVCSMAAEPGVVVDVAVRPRGLSEAPVEVVAVSFGERYGYDPTIGAPGRQPLIEAAIAEIGVPDGGALTLTVRSAVPPGSATGTSAAVTVAVVGALIALRDGAVGPAEVARTAHLIETERLGRQSGIQDHLVAAHGGICDIRMARYPDSTVTRLPLDAEVWRALDDRIGVVSLGRAHDSPAIHHEVIATLGADGGRSALLDPLRRAAGDGADALLRGDLAGFGAAMSANTRAQAALHPGLVSADAWRVIEVAERSGAAGVKVNGAGGDGGSLTILAGPVDIGAVLAAVEGVDPRFHRVALRPSGHGLRVRVEPAT